MTTMESPEQQHHQQAPQPGLFRVRRSSELSTAGVAGSREQDLILQRREAKSKYVPSHPGFLFPLIETLARLKGEGQPGVFGFVGPESGVGVSYVTRLLAQELSVEYACRVLLGDAKTFEKDAPIRGYLELVPGVWTYIDDDDLAGMTDAVKDSVFTNLKPSDFEFVIIDCRPVNETGDALRMSNKVDGMFLVVAAGQTKRAQIEHAKGMLQYATNRLVGLVLNRRTYPVPKQVFELL